MTISNQQSKICRGVTSGKGKSAQMGALLEATRGFACTRKGEALMIRIKGALHQKGALLESTRGFEPLMRVLQTLALPLGHVAGSVIDYLPEL